MHVCNEQEQVRRLTAENAALNQQLQQLQDRSQKVVREEVRGVSRLFITCAAVNLVPVSIHAAPKLASRSLNTLALAECALQESPCCSFLRRRA